jgi:hypothetical protein
MTHATAVADQRPIGYPSDLANRLQDLILPSMFWSPAHLTQSAWLEHVPFAFWLVDALRPKTVVELGTHYGLSYFAFCQAVDRLGLDASCFAIDSWKGDKHAGFYTEAVFESVSKINTQHYSTFSRLVRSSFEAAAEHFAPGSIDLLHIDGLHTLESVRGDFETWRPKLSEGAVVLFHDTNVRERDFGVSSYFVELRREYPAFEFVHGHGLGVVCVGVTRRPLVAALLQADGDQGLRHAVRDVFGRLGRGVADSHYLAIATDRLVKLRAAEAESQARLREIETMRSDLAARDAEIARLAKRLDDRDRAIETRFLELAALTEDRERERETTLLREARLATLADVEANYKVVTRKYEDLITYARGIERAHASVLSSTSWRLLEPVRAIMRLLTRKKRPNPFKPRL